MDNFEKQQTVETLKTVIKARWFYAGLIFLQGIAIKLFFPSVPLPSHSVILAILLSAFLFNFIYSVYLRQPTEKMSELGLKTIKATQVVMDQLWISAILYFSGTVGKMIVVTYVVSIMIGAALYKKRGVVITTLSCQFFFTVLALLQYNGLLKAPVPVQEVFTFDVKNKNWLAFALIAFYCYVSAAAVFAAQIASLFRRREANLQTQKNELGEKAETLIRQAKELTETKDWLHQALARSDMTRADLEKAKRELEKTNSALEAKIEELEKFNRLTVGREIKMGELKKEIAKLKEDINKQ